MTFRNSPSSPILDPYNRFFYHERSSPLTDLKDRLESTKQHVLKDEQEIEEIETTLNKHFYDVITCLHDKLLPSASPIPDQKSVSTHQDNELAAQIKTLGNFTHDYIKIGFEEKQIYRAFLQKCAKILSSAQAIEFKETLVCISDELLILCQTNPLNDDRMICPISQLPIESLDIHFTTSGFQVNRYCYMEYLRKYKVDPFTNEPALSKDKYDFPKNPEEYFLYNYHNYLYNNTLNPEEYFFYNYDNNLNNNKLTFFSSVLFIEYVTPILGYLLTDFFNDISTIQMIINSSWVHWICPLQQTMLSPFVAITMGHLFLSCVAILSVYLFINGCLSYYQKKQAESHADAYHRTKTQKEEAKKQMPNHVEIELYDTLIAQHMATKEIEKPAPTTLTQLRSP